MNKKDYLALAAELEVNVTDDNTVAEIKEALCDTLINERKDHEAEVAGLNDSLSLADKKAEVKEEVVSIKKKNYRFIGKKHLLNGVEITSEKLNADSDLAEACLEKEVGFLVKL